METAKVKREERGSSVPPLTTSQERTPDGVSARFNGKCPGERWVDTKLQCHVVGVKGQPLLGLYVKDSRRRLWVPRVRAPG